MSTFDRRDFLKASATISAALFLGDRFSFAADGASTRNKIETFDYDGVILRDSRWQKQFKAARDYYFNVSNDDILHGWRRAAGLAAPGKPLGGWCNANSNTVFGQWLQGMARIYKATNDVALRDKAILLMTEWAKTIKPDGDCGMRHYPFEKLVGGLVDLKTYCGNDQAVALLSKVCDFAIKNFNHDNIAAADRRGGYAGSPNEWYTLAENIFRAYQLTGDEKYKTFAQMWLYNAYWDKFVSSTAPDNVHGVHAYSHVNTFSSAAMAYAITGDQKYLTTIKNAYDFLQEHQCFATGGYGPTEFIVTNDGGLGRSLVTRTDSFETVCGSWAGFKLGRYLMCFTGDARFGDWIERLLYNGIGSALPIAEGGKNFYYSDYKLSGAFKVYCWENYTCCSGTYIQAVAEYHNLIYFKDSSSLYVNLYLPSEVNWKRPDGDVKLTQETSYPESETSTLTLSLPRSSTFSLKFRIPAWAKNVSLRINGQPVDVQAKPGDWATLTRAWNNNDKIEIRIPLPLRMVPVDKEHPNVVAIVRGPTVLVLEATRHDPLFRLPDTDDELNKWISPFNGRGSAGDNGVQSVAGIPGAFNMRTPEGPIRSLFRPFYTIEENFAYNMYFDKKTLPNRYW